MQGLVAGGIMGEMEGKPPKGDPLNLTGAYRGASRGLLDPVQRDRYNQAFGNMMFGPEAKNPTMPQRIGRGVENFGLQTASDPVTHGGGAAMKNLVVPALKAGAGAVARGVAPVGKYAAEVQGVLRDPHIAPAVAKVAHAVSTMTAPLRFGVNTGKELLFLNPLPHGLGDMSTLNYLRNGLGTAAKGLRYGVTGAPAKTAAELEGMGAGAWTPELMTGAHSQGLISKLGRIPVPAAVRAAGGGAAGGAIGSQTAPSNATEPQRLARTAEGTLLGALTGVAPEALNASNRLMTRLETGHRAAMLEDLPKPPSVAPPKPRGNVPAGVDPETGEYTPGQHGPATMRDVGTRPAAKPQVRPVQHWPLQHGKITVEQANAFYADLAKKKAAAEAAAEAARKADPRAAEINSALGGAAKSGFAKVATAFGGPFAGWQFDTVPRAVGSALVKHPARVEAVARAQDITNRDVLAGKPYKAQVGGPIGGFAEMMFNTPKYASRLFGPLGQSDPNAATSPKSLSLEDAVKGAAYQGVPGRSIVGPMFGDTMYPSKAPAGPSAALSDLLGWHFANKTPKQDAILSIMKATGMDAYQAGKMYDRYKPR